MPMRLIKADKMKCRQIGVSSLQLRKVDPIRDTLFMKLEVVTCLGAADGI